MKVAIVSVGTLPIPAVDGGAVETLIDNLISENEKKNFLDIDVYSIYSEKAEKKSKVYANTNYNYIKTNKFIQLLDSSIYAVIGKIFKKYTMSYRYIVQRIVYSWKIRKYINENYDVVLFEASQFLSIALLGNIVDRKTSIIFHAHNQLKKGFFLEKMLRKSDGILSVSNFIQNYLIRSYPTIENEKFFTLRNQVDTTVFQPNKNEKAIIQLKKQYGIKDNDTILVFLGRISREKGVIEVCEALEKLNNPNVKLMIIGAAFFNSNIKDQYKLEIRDRFKKLEDSIIFTGYVDHELVPQYLKLADIAVCPALWDEPAALTNMEILSCGIPLITTNGGGTPEYVDEKSTVLLNRDDNLVNNIVSEINKMMMNESYYNSLKRGAMGFYKTVSIDRYYQDFVDILKKLIVKEG